MCLFASLSRSMLYAKAAESINCAEHFSMYNLAVGSFQC